MVYNVKDMTMLFKNGTLIWWLLSLLLRSSHQKCSIKKTFWKLWQNSQQNTCVGVTFSWPATLIKMKLRQKCFPVNLTNFLRTAFLQNTCTRLFMINSNINADIRVSIKIYCQHIADELFDFVWPFCAISA